MKVVVSEEPKNVFTDQVKRMKPFQTEGPDRAERHG